MELDQFLNPVNSPFSKNQGATTPYTFDYSNERGIISTAFIGSAAIQTAQIGSAAVQSANVGTLSFNQISGGTATLGGTSNGNGLLSVKNAGGTEIVQINNGGITVTGGSISVTNSAGSIIIDPTGLVSTSNFISNSMSPLGTTFTGTAYVDWTNTSMSIVVTRTTRAMFTLSSILGMQFVNNSNYGIAELAMDLNGAVTNAATLFVDTQNYEPTATARYTPKVTQSFNYITTLSSGTTNIKVKGRMQFKVGTPTFAIGDGQFSYILLGS